MDNENSKLMSLLMGAGIILGASQCIAMETENVDKLERSLWTIESSQEELNFDFGPNSGCNNSGCNNGGCR